MLTGFADLDGLTGGFPDGGLVFLAARPLVGKTAFAIGVASDVVRRQPGTGRGTAPREPHRAAAFFNLQPAHTKERFVQRVIAQVGRFSVRDLRSGNVVAEDWPRYVWSVAEISEAPLYLGGSPNLSVREMREDLDGVGRGLAGVDAELGLVVVDYFQLMLPPGRIADREARGGEILGELRSLARDLNVPVLVLAELGHYPERRRDRRPWLTDFGPAEPVEEFADMVMFLYRDEYYDPDTDDKGIAEVIVAKNRDGRTGKVQLAWLERYAKFISLSRRG